MKILSMDELRNLDIPEPLALVGDNLFLWNGKFVIYGPSGTYNSFLTQQLMFCISEGQDWFGHKVHQTVPSAYVELESTPKGKQQRLENLGLAYGVRGTQFYQTLEYDFSLTRDFKVLIKEMQERGIKAVALDPLNLMMEGSEISGQVMADITRAANIIRAETQALVGVVHHMNKGSYHEGKRVDKGIDEASGHKNLMNWTDTAIRVERVDLPYTAKVRVDKVREGDLPPEQWVRFDRDMKILVPSDNDPRTLIIAKLKAGPATGGEIDKMLKDQAGMGKNAASAMRTRMEGEDMLRGYADPTNTKRKLWILGERI